MHRGYLKFLAVGQAHLNRPAFSDDVQTGCDQAICGNDKAGTNALLVVVTTELSQDNDGFTDLLGQALRIKWLIRWQLLAKRKAAPEKQAKRHQHPKKVHTGI